MPPKRRYDRKAEEALPQIPALQTKGWTSEMVKGIMFGIVYAGKTMADAANACGVDVSTVSRTVRAMEHLLDEDLEARLNPRQPTPDRPTNTDEPSTIAKAIEEKFMEKSDDGRWTYENSREIREAVLAEGFGSVSVRTVQRRLKELGGKWVRRPKTTALNELRMANRVTVAQQLLKHESENNGYFESICFSDESYFRASDLNIHAYRRPGEKRHEMQPRRENHWSAKVHCWGIIGIGFKQLVVLEKNVCSETYCAMLEKHLFDPDETSFISDNRILMQDGAKPHTAKATMAYLKEKKVELLPWAPYSPDWNPIEQIWGLMKRKLDVTCFTKREDLIAEVLSVWEDLDQAVIDRMCLDFGCRLVRCIERKGDDATN
jgi:transposase